MRLGRLNDWDFGTSSVFRFGLFFPSFSGLLCVWEAKEKGWDVTKSQEKVHRVCERPRNQRNAVGVAIDDMLDAKRDTKMRSEWFRWFEALDWLLQWPPTCSKLFYSRFSFSQLGLEIAESFWCMCSRTLHDHFVIFSAIAKERLCCWLTRGRKA